MSSLAVNGLASGSHVVPRSTASPRGSLKAEFSWPRPQSRPLLPRSWPRSRL